MIPLWVINEKTFRALNHFHKSMDFEDIDKE